MSPIERELVKATNFDNDDPGIDRQDFLVGLVTAANNLSDREFRTLSPAAQEWLNAAVESVRNNDTVEDFPDTAVSDVEDGEPEAPPKRRGRPAEQVAQKIEPEAEPEPESAPETEEIEPEPVRRRATKKVAAAKVATKVAAKKGGRTRLVSAKKAVVKTAPRSKTETKIKQVADRRAKVVAKVAAKAANSARKTATGRFGAKREIIYNMLTRKSGTTQKEVMTKLGWPSISLKQQAEFLGLKLRVEKGDGRENRYYGTP